MPAMNRRQWMRDYMRDYRQGKLRGEAVEGRLHSDNPDKHEKLKEANRLNTFKWRISKLLGPQYEILLCVQYGPEYGDFKDMIYPEELCADVDEVITWFPVLKHEGFIDICNTGGEIFKTFLLEKYNRKMNQLTDVWLKY